MGVLYNCLNLRYIQRPMGKLDVGEDIFAKTRRECIPAAHRLGKYVYLPHFTVNNNCEYLYGCRR